MENNNENSGNTSWIPPGNTGGGELPGAKASQIMGIIGLVLSFCFGCGLIGLILSILAFSKGKSAVATYESNPGGYLESDYKKAKTGKLLGLIGIALAVIVIILGIIYYAAGMPKLTAN